jgi:hypothetical protein
VIDLSLDLALPPESQAQWGRANWAVSAAIFYAVAVGAAVAALVWLWQWQAEIGFAVTLVVLGCLFHGAVRLLQHSRRRHLAHEAMLRELNRREAESTVTSN